jgi:hypothetical protein
MLLALWVWLFIALGTLAGGPNGDSFGTDFAMFYSAAKVTAHGGNPYDSVHLFVVERALTHAAHLRMASALYVRVANPPLFFWALEPLTRLPYQLAAYIWIGGMYLLAAIGFVVALTYFGWTQKILATVLFLAMPQVMLGMYYANVNGLEFGALAGGLALQRRYPALGGLVLSLTWLKPQIGLPLAALIALFHTPSVRRMATGFLVGSIGLLAVNAAALGPASLVRWIGALLEFRRHATTYTDISSLGSVFSGFGSQALSGILQVAAIVLATVLTAAWWMHVRGEGEVPFRAVGWLWGVWMLVTPLLHFHDELVLAIPLLAVLGTNGKDLGRWPVIAALYTSYFSIIALAIRPGGVEWIWVPLLLLTVCLFLGRRCHPHSIQDVHVRQELDALSFPLPL